MRSKARKWNYYGIKIIYQMTVSGEPIHERVDEMYCETHTYFEESILLIHAQSFDHAYSIAEKKSREEVHINPYGQTVSKKVLDAIDCFLILDEIESGCEIYSSITPAEKRMKPRDYVMEKYHFNLDDYTWNEDYEKQCEELQTVLRYEEFSKWRNMEPGNAK